MHESKLHRVQIPSNQGPSMAQGKDLISCLMPSTSNYVYIALATFFVLLTADFPQADASWSCRSRLKTSSVLSKLEMHCCEYFKHLRTIKLTQVALIQVNNINLHLHLLLVWLGVLIWPLTMLNHYTSSLALYGINNNHASKRIKLDNPLGMKNTTTVLLNDIHNTSIWTLLVLFFGDCHIMSLASGFKVLIISVGKPKRAERRGMVKCYLIWCD